MEKRCERPGCQSPVESKRRDARFCSDKCRAQVSKAKHRLPTSPRPSPAPRPTQVAPQRLEVPPALPAKEEEPLIEDEDLNCFSYDLDQGGYDPARPRVRPRDTVGRIARVEELLNDLRYTVQLLEQRLKQQAERPPQPEDVGEGSDAQIRAIVRAELAEAMKPLRERPGRSLPVAPEPQPAVAPQRISRLEAQLKDIAEELREVKERVEALAADSGEYETGEPDEDGDEDEDETGEPDEDGYEDEDEEDDDLT